MRRPVMLVVVFLVMFALSLPAQAQVRAALFQFSGVYDQQFTTVATREMSRILADLGRFSVVAQKQPFGNQSDAEVSAAAQQVGASVAFVGFINALGAVWDKTTSTYSAQAAITIRAIDANSGQVLHVFAGNATASHSDEETACRYALEASFSPDLIANLKEAFQLRSTVLNIKDGILFVPLGAGSGVRKGQRFQVLRPAAGVTEDVFMPQIALAQVTQVTGSMSEARVLWRSENIKLGDVIKEVPRPNSYLNGVGLQFGTYSATSAGGEKAEGSALTLQGQLGMELPYSHFWGLVASYATIEGTAQVISIGPEFSKEIRLISGLLYLSAAAQGDVSLAKQPYSGYENSEGTAVSKAMQAKGSLGLRLYLSRGNGLRLDVGATAAAGSSFSSWQAAVGKKPDVTDYVQYPEISLNGLGWHAGLSYAF